MKAKLLFIVLISLFSSSLVSAASTPNFSLRNFASCQEFQTTLRDIMITYQDRYWQPYGGGILESITTPEASRVNAQAEPSSIKESLSQTNTQVAGVDESDIVKIDGKYIYQYRYTTNTIEIIQTDTLKHISTIKPEQNISGISLYVSGDRLVIIGNKNQPDMHIWLYRWYYPNNKTAIIVYDIKNPSAPKILHSHVVDGYAHDSRLVGNTLYFLTQSDLRIAPAYPMLYKSDKNGLSQTVDELKKNFSLRNVVPQIQDSIPNPKFPNRYLTSTRAGVSRCEDISVVLPDMKSLQSVDLSPVFTVIGSLDISRANTKVQSTLVFGAVSQIHMSQKSLYLLSSVGKNISNPCPPNARCFVPPQYEDYTTLIHRFDIQGSKPVYKNTTQVPGNPLSQYSMDEDIDGNFRLVTVQYGWTSGINTNSTRVSVVDPSGKLIGSLAGLAKGENFQSSRFIGNRLYLVTFQQIDPLFVIDLTTSTAPRVLGELKISGYSLYLHPYDENRLIGLGYDTFQNTNGGTQNGGIKVDLYNVSDVKNPLREATLTLGDANSSSDVLSNPRAFVWYKEKNLLLLPATLMKSAKDASNPYRYTGAFQGVIGISITPGSISEKFRLSHLSSSASLESAWKKECSSYSSIGTPTCVTLMDGSRYCPTQQYIPAYCYAGATVDEYFANTLWNFSSDFVTRALYAGNTVYSLAESGIKSWNLNNPTTPLFSLGFPMEANNMPKPIPVDPIRRTSIN